MRNKFMAVVAGLAIAATSLMAVSPADAQWRGGRHGGYHGGYHGGHHRGYYGGGGALLGGLAAGAIIGGAFAAQEPYVYGPGYVEGDAVDYCLSRFKSYDPGSGTYLGYDGLRHPCP